MSDNTQIQSGIKERKKRSPNAAPSGGQIPLQRSGQKISERIYGELRDQIVSLDLPPQTPISEQMLSQRHGSSRTPIREALRRLADEKLVEVIPKSGTFVSRIPISLLREALVARRALEAVTANAAAQADSAQQISVLYNIVDQQKNVASTSKAEQFHQLDKEFHHQIALIAKYPGIWDIIQQMRVHIDRFRLLTLPKPGRMEQVINEHFNIADAIANGDTGAATTIMDAHLNQLHEDMSEFPDLSPNFFIHDWPLTKS